MNTTVRNYLIELARNRTNQTVNYQQLCYDCKLHLEMSIPNDRLVIGEILDEISRFENAKEQRPLLSALVIRKGDNFEGDGFYKLAQSLGKGDWKKLKRDGMFEIMEIKKCVEFWSDPVRYNKFKNN